MSETENIDKANELLKTLSKDIKNLKMPTGDDDFKSVLNNGCVYLDKTLLAKEILDSGEKAILITRPRRWGKTLAMSMLKYFLALEVDGEGKEIEDNSNKALFDNLEIAKTDAIQKQGKYPVIFISFKDVQCKNYQEIEKSIGQIMSAVFKEFAYIYDNIKKKNMNADIADLAQFDRILKRTADKVEIASGLGLLSKLISEYHGKKPFLLIDEYDLPLNNTYNTNHYNDTLSLIKGMFTSGVKGNLYMEKGVVTGVFKIAKSGLWTGMNNSSDYSILNSQYAQYFGFTESEVDALLQEANIQDKTITSAVKEWYNGYNIGGLTMYNPWSIINFFFKRQIAPYWVNTESAVAGERRLSTDVMITEQVHNEINLLIANFGKETLKITINPEVVFITIDQEADALWGLLLFGGYLSVESFTYDSTGRIVAQAKIPNREVLSIYNSSISLWVKEKLLIDSKKFNELKENFILEDVDSVKATINKTLELYEDRIAKENENIFHGLIQSICLLKGAKHQVASESYSGFGRIDSIFYPVKGKSDTIVIHEYKIIKKLKNESQLKKVLINAIWQVYEKIYMEVPLLHNKYFEGIASAVELRAIVILCNPIAGAEKKFTCEIMIKNHSIAEMKKIAKVFQTSSQDEDQIDMIKAKIDIEAEKYIEAYTKKSLRKRKRNVIDL